MKSAWATYSKLEKTKVNIDNSSNPRLFPALLISLNLLISTLPTHAQASELTLEQAIRSYDAIILTPLQSFRTKFPIHIQPQANTPKFHHASCIVCLFPFSESVNWFCCDPVSPIGSFVFKDTLTHESETSFDSNFSGTSHHSKHSP